MSTGGTRPRTLAGKAWRFAAVGVVNTAIDMICFAALLALAVPPLAANAAAWLVAVAFSYAANSRWSFERDRTVPEGRSVLRFIAGGAVITFGVSSLAIATLAASLGPFAAKVIGIVAAAVLNFAAARWAIEHRLR